MDDRGRAFVINGHFYQWSGMSFAKVNVSKKIPEFREVKPIDELEFWPLSDSRRPVLRGEPWDLYTAADGKSAGSAMRANTPGSSTPSTRGPFSAAHWQGLHECRALDE